MSRYKKESTKLFERKELLFSKKNIGKWDLNPQQLNEINFDELLNDKQECLKLMLPKESLLVSLQKEELGYYNYMFMQEARSSLEKSSQNLIEKFYKFVSKLRELAKEVNLVISKENSKKKGWMRVDR